MTHRLEAGDVLVLSAASGGKVCVADTSGLVFWCFSLCMEHLFPLFATSEIYLLQTVLDKLKEPRLYPANEPVANMCHRLLADVPPQSDLDHRTQLLRVVSAILTLEFKKAHNQRVGFIRTEEHLIQVFERLSADQLLTLSVGELASKFSCSRRHLNRLFHQYFGFSVAALRMEMRLLKAVSLLRDPDAKVINVAERCGFNHLGLFNTCFKRRFGTSPGQWRKSGVGTKPGTTEVPVGELDCPLRANGLCPMSASRNDRDPNPSSTICRPTSVPASRPPESLAPCGCLNPMANTISTSFTKREYPFRAAALGR
ncbi:MAG: helix-turn-helix transcriptional regulator [Verrucomicrobiae bacterium]|nr:helix-turn-helix transcriptional regulator [Verrucomicrobiae bacterium]